MSDEPRPSPNPDAAAPRRDRARGWVLGLLGGAVGGVVGYFIFVAIIKQGYYAMVLPGAFIGLGAGAVSGRRSVGLGAVCGVAALVLGVFIESRWMPFVADRSLSYFLAHLGEVKWFDLAMIGVGALFAFWFGLGRERGVWFRRQTPER